MSSPAWTLGSWVRTPLEAWIFVLSCVGGGLATGWSLVQGVLPFVYKCKITEPHKEEAKARNGLQSHIRRRTLLLWEHKIYLNTTWWNESHDFVSITVPQVSGHPPSQSIYLTVCDGVRSTEQCHQAHSNCAAVYAYYRVFLLYEDLGTNCIFASQEQNVPLTCCYWYCI
jgi:hypothetical protein